jgi:hypothetical protein
MEKKGEKELGRKRDLPTRERERERERASDFFCLSTVGQTERERER